MRRHSRWVLRSQAPKDREYAPLWGVVSYGVLSISKRRSLLWDVGIFYGIL
jgi:hypothetical protein